VKVKSREMSMSVGYSFKGDAKVSKEQAESAIAKSLDIDQSQVSVEILTRRLKGQLRGRKLAEETRIKATITMDANDEAEIEKAQAAHEKLADPEKSADMLENVKKVLSDEADIEIDLPEVTEAPQVEVKVETEIIAVFGSETPVKLPTEAVLQEIAIKAGAEDIEVTDVKTFTTDPIVMVEADNTTADATTTTVATSTVAPTTTTTTGGNADRYVYQGTFNLTMSAEDGEKLTADITKAKKVFEAATASVTGLNTSEVTMTKIYYGDGDSQFRRLADHYYDQGPPDGPRRSRGAHDATGSVIGVEFLISSGKPAATNFKASDLEAAIEKAAKAEGIEGIDVTVTKSTITLVSSPPAPARADEDSSSVAIVLTVLLICLAILGMIGGFFYWYREELKTWYYRKAGKAEN